MAAVEIHVHKYRLGEKIGSGSFGDLYKGYHLEQKGHVAAIKLELLTAKHPQLGWEYRIYHLLAEEKAFPPVYYYDTMGKYNVLVMELLKEDVETMFNKLGRRMSLSTVQYIARDVLNCMEILHNHGVLHRDVKPDNFLRRDDGQVTLIDFGLAKFWKGKNGKHIPRVTNQSFVGTARYSSINSHLGIEQSRRDDMEALMHVFIYLAQGGLPWQNFTKRNEVRKAKEAYTPEQLCDGLPPGFAKALRYTRQLGFSDKPNYKLIRLHLGIDGTA